MKKTVNNAAKVFMLIGYTVTMCAVAELVTQKTMEFCGNMFKSVLPEINTNVE